MLCAHNNFLCGAVGDSGKANGSIDLTRSRVRSTGQIMKPCEEGAPTQSRSRVLIRRSVPRDAIPLSEKCTSGCGDDAHSRRRDDLVQER